MNNVKVNRQVYLRLGKYIVEEQYNYIFHVNESKNET